MTGFRDHVRGRPLRSAADLDAGEERYVVLGHMKKGTVVAELGKRIYAGDPVGHVGNSGNTSEPHLHLHVQDGPTVKQHRGIPFTVARVKQNGAVVRDAVLLRGDFLQAVPEQSAAR